MDKIRKKPEEIFMELLHRYPQAGTCSSQIEMAYQALAAMYEQDGCLYIAGNGGSAADSEHIAGELMKSFMFQRRLDSSMQAQLQKAYGKGAGQVIKQLEGGLAAVPLPSLISAGSAIANDISGSMVYAQLLYAAAKKNDAFLGISTSGNSENIINAMIVAKAKNIVCLGMAGEHKCRMDEIADVVIHAPESETYKIQELHVPIYHALCAMLESHFFDIDRA